MNRGCNRDLALSYASMCDLSHLAQPGASIHVRVTPKASRNRIELVGGDTVPSSIRVYVTAAPDGGKANTAVQKLLARAIGIAPTRLVLVRGQTARDKLFRVE